MKRLALIASMVCLLVVGIIGCAPEPDEDKFAAPTSTGQIDVDAQVIVASEEESAEQILMEDYAARKDELFAGLGGTFTASARVEETFLVYTYVFYDPDLCRDGLSDMFEKMCLEGPMIIAESQAVAPGFTGAVIQFQNAEGETLERREFY